MSYEIFQKMLFSFLSCVVLVAMMVPVHAQTNQAAPNLTASKNALSTSVINLQKANDVKLMYYPCPATGQKHHMVGRGRGKAYKGAYPSTDLQINGYCTQCRDCKLFIISEYEPLWADVKSLGKYTSGNADYDLSNLATVYYTNDFWYNSSLANDPFFKSFAWFPHG